MGSCQGCSCGCQSPEGWSEAWSSPIPAGPGLPLIWHCVDRHGRQGSLGTRERGRCGGRALLCPWGPVRSLPLIFSPGPQFPGPGAQDVWGGPYGEALDLLSTPGWPRVSQTHRDGAALRAAEQVDGGGPSPSLASPQRAPQWRWRTEQGGRPSRDHRPPPPGWGARARASSFWSEMPEPPPLSGRVLNQRRADASSAGSLAVKY